MFRIAIIVAAAALVGCQTTQLSEELPKKPVMERVDGRSVSESDALAEIGRRDTAACNDEVQRADRESRLPITPEKRLALLKEFSQAKAYVAYEQAKIDVYVSCMERRGYRRSSREATLRP